jgi:thioredoxin reductase (NADPH)
VKNNFWGKFLMKQKSQKAMIVCSGLFSLLLLNNCLSDSGEHHIPQIITKQYLLQTENIVPVVILGSGPAGLSAAIYAARAKRHAVVLHGDKPGGLLTETTWVENWPGSEKILGPDLIEQMKKHAQEFGVQFLYDTVESVDFSHWPFAIKTQDGLVMYALTLIIATGAAPKRLGIVGEEQYWGAGVTSCAVCDAPFYKDKNVIVVGGGDAAIEESIQLASYAKKVTILVRGDHMRAAGRMQDLVKNNKKIGIEYNKIVSEILGDGDRVTGVRVVDVALGSNSIVPVDGIFLAIGHKPNTDLFKEKLNINKDGYILIKSPSQQTSLEGVFAAGDVEDFTYRQAGVASGSGIRAALDADRFLAKHGFTDDMAIELNDKLFFPPKSYTDRTIRIVNALGDFQEAIAEETVPVMVDFYAEYCPPCMQMLPIFESIAQQYSDQMNFIKVNTQYAQAIVEHYRVSRVPTIVLFNKGKVVQRHEQAMNREQLIDAIKSVQP